MGLWSIHNAEDDEAFGLAPDIATGRTGAFRVYGALPPLRPE